MPPLLHRQPWKLVYLLYFAVSLVIRVPYWFLTSIPRSRRPLPGWSISKCIHIYMTRTFLPLPLLLGIKANARDLSQEVQDSALKNAKFVWVQGVKEDILQGELKEYTHKAGVKSERIPGFWQFKSGTRNRAPAKAEPGEKVMYHIHGGAFWLGTAHPSDMTAGIPRGILKHTKTMTRIFAIDYRLCSAPPFKAANPFPTAVLDGLSGYKYLLDLGFEPKNITFAGDSAGGNICMAILRYLTRHENTGLPLPGRLLLLSPWMDLSSSRTSPNSSMIKNAMTDIFPYEPIKPKHKVEEFGGYGIRSYLGTAFTSEDVQTNPYLSPASAHFTGVEGMFKGYPKTYIASGGAERILDDSTVIAEQLKADNPSDEWVIFDVAEDSVHDFLIFNWHEPQRTETLLRICKWLDAE